MTIEKIDPNLLDNVREFVRTFYADMDELNDMRHINRTLAEARSLADGEYDDTLLACGAHFHGMIATHDNELRDFLSDLGFPRERNASIIQVAAEASRESVPETVEGNLLHDAHLVEGGPEFQLARLLTDATQRGQSLRQTVESIDTRVIGRYKATTPRGKQRHAEVEMVLRRFVTGMQAALELGKNPSH